MRRSDGPYPEQSHSLLGISNPNVVLWALKPAEDGIAAGAIAREWNLAASPSRFALSLAEGLTRAKETTHIETNLADARLQGGALVAELNGNLMQTYRLIPRQR